MNVAFVNESGCFVSVVAHGGRIEIRSEYASADLGAKQAEKLRSVLAEVEMFEGTADYSDDEKRVIKHFLLARHVL